MTMLVRALVVLYGLASLGCNADRAAACSAGGAPGSGDDCDTIACGVAATQFPSFDKSCATPADCVIGVHQINCCGSTLAIGMNRAEQARFTADEQACASQYPHCACAQTATAEDGQSALGKDVVVLCRSGQCMTAVQ